MVTGIVTGTITRSEYVPEQYTKKLYGAEGNIVGASERTDVGENWK